MLCVKCQWGNFGHPKDMYSKHETTFGIHGGDVETSLMLAFAPETVDMQKAINFVSNAETDAISPIGPVSRGWISTDLNPDGTVGDASNATAERGKATADHQVAGFIAMLREIRVMPTLTARSKV